MKVKLENIPALVKRFGILNAIQVYFSLRSGRAIKLPGITGKIWLRKDTSDIDTFFQIFVNKEYGNVKAYDVKYIIDGGANIGLFSMQMKSLFPDAEIYCIEPDAENFEQLNKNLANYTNITTIKAGLWNKSTRLSVDNGEGEKWKIKVTEDIENGTVEAISISDLIKKYNIPRIDILKLDIETSEKKIFSSDCSDWLLKTRMLVVELHDFMEEGCAKEFFKKILSTYDDFTYYVSGENSIIINKALLQ